MDEDNIDFGISPRDAGSAGLSFVGTSFGERDINIPKWSPLQSKTLASACASKDVAWIPLLECNMLLCLTRTRFKVGPELLHFSLVPWWQYKKIHDNDYDEVIKWKYYQDRTDQTMCENSSICNPANESTCMYVHVDNSQHATQRCQNLHPCR